MDQDYYEGTDYLSPVPGDGDRTEEFEYEVRLALANQNAQYLCLTVLCAIKEFIHLKISGKVTQNVKAFAHICVP